MNNMEIDEQKLLEILALATLAEDKLRESSKEITALADKLQLKSKSSNLIKTK